MYKNEYALNNVTVKYRPMRGPSAQKACSTRRHDETPSSYAQSPVIATKFEEKSSDVKKHQIYNVCFFSEKQQPISKATAKFFELVRNFCLKLPNWHDFVKPSKIKVM